MDVFFLCFSGFWLKWSLDSRRQKSYESSGPGLINFGHRKHEKHTKRISVILTSLQILFALRNQFSFSWETKTPDNKLSRLVLCQSSQLPWRAILRTKTSQVCWTQKQTKWVRFCFVSAGPVSDARYPMRDRPCLFCGLPRKYWCGSTKRRINWFRALSF